MPIEIDGLPMKNGGSFYGLTVESYPQIHQLQTHLLSQEGGENEPLLERGMKRRVFFSRKKWIGLGLGKKNYTISLNIQSHFFSMIAICPEPDLFGRLGTTDNDCNLICNPPHPPVNLIMIATENP